MNKMILGMNISVLSIFHYLSLFSASTTRQIRDLYNIRSGGTPILQHSDDDKEFQSILIKALEVTLKNLQIKFS
jgi:hypothetical protein